MSKEILDILGDIGCLTNVHASRSRNTLLKAPFAYVGNKRQSFRHIEEYLPYTGRYVEVFGGSGVVLLNRMPQEFEVFNDRYSGLIDFYKCLQSFESRESLKDFLRDLPASRELWYDFKNTFCVETDPVIRAGKWFYMHQLSFGSKESSFGRNLDFTKLTKTRLFKNWQDVARRMRNVLIENLSWETMFADFDNKDTVFYLDPPYVPEAMGSANHYKFNMPRDEHKRLLQAIFNLEGYVALSGYSNTLYDDYDWDDKISWEVTSTISDVNSTKQKEFLWIKKAR